MKSYKEQKRTEKKAQEQVDSLIERLLEQKITVHSAPNGQTYDPYK